MARSHTNIDMDIHSQERGSPSLAAALSPDKHGSEEPWRSPTQDLASPSLGLEVPASNLEASGISAASDRSPLQGRLPDKPVPAPVAPADWTTPQLVNWLEELSWVPPQGIQYITSLEADGEFLTTLVDSDHCEEILAKEFGIDDAGHRLLLVSRLRKLCRTAKEAKLSSFASPLCRPTCSSVTPWSNL